MIDSSNGKVLRTLTEVHPPGTAVLHVKVNRFFLPFKGGGVRDNLKQKTLFSLIFYGDTA